MLTNDLKSDCELLRECMFVGYFAQRRGITTAQAHAMIDASPELSAVRGALQDVTEAQAAEAVRSHRLWLAANGDAEAIALTAAAGDRPTRPMIGR